MNPPFRSAIFYSVQNEDYETELAVLRRIDAGVPLRVLMVASSGENVLSVLTQSNVAAVYAVDLNPAQLHLCHLRQTAVFHLSRDEQLQLLAADPATAGIGNGAERLALYAKLRPALPEATRAFWDERQEQELAFGVQHVGRNEVCMHDLQERLAAAGFAPLKRPLTDPELPTWQTCYTELMTPTYMRDLFGLPSEALAARIASIAPHLATCHFRALQQPQAETNPFVTTVFANRYAAGDPGLPLYLQADGQTALRQLGTAGRLHLIAGNMLEQLPLLAAAEPFDCISLSNIADWMTAEQFAATIELAMGCLRSGGAVLARTAVDSPMITNVIRQKMAFDEPFNSQLPTIERGPWFRTLAAGFKPSTCI